MLKPRGRPRKEVTKVAVNIRLPPDVVEAFRATGRGWQTRVDEALKEWLKSHKPMPHDAQPEMGRARPELADKA